MWGTKLLLDGIRNIAPTFYVKGNHEFWSRDIANIKKIIRESGTVVLENETVSLKIHGSTINLCGIDDPAIFDCEKNEFVEKCTSKYDLLANFKNLKKDRYNILLAHRPEWIEEYKKYPFDLILSGHAHGGQVRIPFLLNGLYAPNQGFFPKYAGGTYPHGTLTHIVTRGLYCNPRLPRLFNPPEIVVIDLNGYTLFCFSACK